MVRVTDEKLRKIKRRLRGTRVREHLVRGHFKLSTRKDGPLSVYVSKHIRGKR